MNFGERVVTYRKKNNMTQEMLANMLGVSNQAVSKWEANQNYPDIELIVRMADIFQISLDDLFGRSGYEKNEQIIEYFNEQLPWEDDDTLYAVVYIGHRLQKFECLDLVRNVEFRYEGTAVNVQSVFSVNCGEVTGNVEAGNSVTCADVGGYVDAGCNVTCSNVGGYVDAGNNVICKLVGGHVDAGGHVECINVGAYVDAGSYVTCGAVGSYVDAGGNVSCGIVAGDVSAGGSVTCGDVEGDITAGGRVTYKEK